MDGSESVKKHSLQVRDVAGAVRKGDCVGFPSSAFLVPEEQWSFVCPLPLVLFLAAFLFLEVCMPRGVKKLTQDQIDKMQAGRKNRKEKKVLAKTPKKAMSEDHKKKIQDALKKSREERKARGEVTGRKKRTVVDLKAKPIIYITGKEKDAFDYFSAIRSAFRSKHDYISSPIIVKKIVAKNVWNNKLAIEEIISTFGDLKRKKNQHV